MLSWLRSFCPSCRCGSVVGTNWTCSHCRNLMARGLKGVTNSQLDPRLKASLIILGSGVVLMDAYWNPVSYESVLEQQHSEGISPPGAASYQSIEGLYNTSCTLCLDDFQVSDQVIHTPCRHTYHYTCMRGREFRECPNCRYRLVPPLTVG